MKKLLALLFAIAVIAGCGTGEKSNSSEEQNSKNSAVELEKMTFAGEITQSEQTVTFDFYIENEHDEAVTVTFPTGQMYDIVITDEQGKAIYQFSEGRMFTQALTERSIPAHDKLAFQEQWDIPDNVPNGAYDVTIYLVATHINEEEIPAKRYQFNETLLIEKAEDVFRNVSVTGTNGEYTVTGEASVFEGTFYYTVEDGHDYLIEETVVTVEEGAPNWSDFEFQIAIPQDKLTNTTLTLELYEKSAENGEPIHHVTLQLDRIE